MSASAAASSAEARPEGQGADDDDNQTLGALARQAKATSSGAKARSDSSSISESSPPKRRRGAARPQQEGPQLQQQTASAQPAAQSPQRQKPQTVKQSAAKKDSDKKKSSEKEKKHCKTSMEAKPPKDRKARKEPKVPKESKDAGGKSDRKENAKKKKEKKAKKHVVDDDDSANQGAKHEDAVSMDQPPPETEPLRQPPAGLYSYFGSAARGQGNPGAAQKEPPVASRSPQASPKGVEEAAEQPASEPPLPPPTEAPPDADQPAAPAAAREEAEGGTDQSKPEQPTSPTPSRHPGSPSVLEVAAQLRQEEQLMLHRSPEASSQKSIIFVESQSPGTSPGAQRRAVEDWDQLMGARLTMPAAEAAAEPVAASSQPALVVPESQSQQQDPESECSGCSYVLDPSKKRMRCGHCQEDYDFDRDDLENFGFVTCPRCQSEIRYVFGWMADGTFIPGTPEEEGCPTPPPEAQAEVEVVPRSPPTSDPQCAPAPPRQEVASSSLVAPSSMLMGFTLDTSDMEDDGVGNVASGSTTTKPAEPAQASEKDRWEKESLNSRPFVDYQQTMVGFSVKLCL